MKLTRYLIDMEQATTSAIIRDISAEAIQDMDIKPEDYEFLLWFEVDYLRKKTKEEKFKEIMNMLMNDKFNQKHVDAFLMTREGKTTGKELQDEMCQMFLQVENHYNNLLRK